MSFHFKLTQESLKCVSSCIKIWELGAQESLNISYFTHHARMRDMNSFGIWIDGWEELCGKNA